MKTIFKFRDQNGKMHKKTTPDASCSYSFNEIGQFVIRDYFTNKTLHIWDTPVDWSLVSIDRLMD